MYDFYNSENQTFLSSGNLAFCEESKILYIGIGS